MAHNSQIVRAKEILNLSYGGSSCRQASEPSLNLSPDTTLVCRLLEFKNTNCVEPYRNADVGAIWFGSTLFDAFLIDWVLMQTVWIRVRLLLCVVCVVCQLDLKHFASQWQNRLIGLALNFNFVHRQIQQFSSVGGAGRLEPTDRKELWFQTMWHIGMNRLRHTCAASFKAWKLQIMFGKKLDIHIIFKWLAKAPIRLRICAGWPEQLMGTHTSLLEPHFATQSCLAKISVTTENQGHGRYGCEVLQ